MSIFDAIRKGQEGRVCRLLRAERSLLQQTEVDSGDTPLIVAVTHGKRDIAKRLVKEGAGVNSRGHQGETALIRAVKGGDEDMVWFLLRQGAADVHTADETGNTSLMWAARLGYVGCAEVLLEGLPQRVQQQCLEQYNLLGQTALYLASLGRHTEMVVYLFSKEQQAKSENDDLAALTYASWEGDLEAVKMLLDAGGLDVEGKDQCGRRALYYAARRGHKNVVSYLLSRGAQPGTKYNVRGRGYVRGCQTLLMLGSDSEEGHVEVVQLLLDATRGRGVDARDGFGRTALSYAAEGGHEKVAAVLLSRGANANTRDHHEMTPFIMASKQGCLEVMRFLCNYREGQGLEERDKSGLTALHYAAQRGHRDVVASLLDWGAQASSMDGARRRPLMLACVRGHLEVVQMLLNDTEGRGLEDKDNEGRTAMHYAAMGGDEEVVAFLLSKGADASTTDSRQMTPLIYACRQGCVEAVQILVEATEGEGLEGRDKDGSTALHHAALEGHKDVVAFLLSKGAQAHSRSKYGRTPFMLACGLGRRRVMPTLLQHMGVGALDERDEGGRTALSLAAAHASESVGPEQSNAMLKALLLAGADPSIADNEGRTPRQLAEIKGYTQCVEAFEWWDRELERPYVLYRARCLHGASTMQHATPAAAVPVYLTARMAAGRAVPTVEITREQEDETGSAGELGKTADVKKEEEDRDAMLRFVVNGLNEQLFSELMESF